jgi:ABC-2 type transport system ATP-binding protein
MPEPAIEVEGLTKYYDDLLAVDHVSFEVEQGEFFGFLGPNGAGKTSTIKMLTNLLIPSEGSATILGMPVNPKAIKLRESIGVVPEVANVFVELTSLENLLFTAEIYGVPRRERKERAKELLSHFGLEDKAKDKAASLSLGLKRRLSIAMGFIHDPEVLFLDEPTSGLDVHSAADMRDILLDLNRAGKTMFYTTHNMYEANELCSRIAVIDKGKIIAIDTPEKLKTIVDRSNSVVVSFDPQPPVEEEERLRSLRGVETVTINGSRVRFTTSEPPVVLDSVYDYARKKDLRIISINTMGPSLEDVFLEITEAVE